MPIIERTQKTLLFEEAARKGITKRQIQTISQIFRNLIGQSDLGTQTLGEPLAPLYTAQEGEIIDISRISAYITGLFRDVQVLDWSVRELEDQLTLINLEFWARVQLARNRARNIGEAASTERQRVAFGGRWAFNDSLNSTTHLNMQLTTAWIDTSEGVAFLPNLNKAQTILPQEIVVREQGLPAGGSALGSSAQQAFDGLEITSWRVMFSQPDTYAFCVVEFPESKNINSVTLDPVGFGVLAIVELDQGKGFLQVLREFVYSRQTFAIDGSKTLRARISFSSTGSSLPRTAGLRSVVFYTANSTRLASVYTSLLRPQYSFNEIWTELDASIPNGCHINTYWSTASGGPWTRVQNKNWYPVNQSTTSTKTISSASTFLNSGGLFRVQLPEQSINDIDGVLAVGVDLLEVSAFKKDWLAEGDSPHTLKPEDFNKHTPLRTWVGVPLMASSSFATNPRLLQLYGTTTLQSSPHYIKRGSNIVLRRRVGGQPYEEMCWAPLVGQQSANTMQPTYNYRFRLHVFCARESFYDLGRYWFIQGYRQVGARSYKEIGRTYGAFSLYINGSLVAADNVPYTVFSDNTLEEGAELGRPFSIRLRTGWNLVELMWNVTDTNRQIADVFDLGDPYLQLCLMPSFLDSDFQQLMNITKIVGSGERRPVSEFDLLWNLPQDPAFWSWSETRESIMFNTVQIRPIDGFFTGQYPRSTLSYQGINFSQEASDIYLRFDLDRDSEAPTGPVLKGYKVMVR